MFGFFFPLGQAYFHIFRSGKQKSRKQGISITQACKGKVWFWRLKTHLFARHKWGLLCLQDFHTHMPFPTDGKETIVMSRSWLCWWGSTVLSRQVPALQTVQHPTAPQHLKKGQSGVLGWGPVPALWAATQQLSKTWNLFLLLQSSISAGALCRSLKPLTHQFG